MSLIIGQYGQYYLQNLSIPDEKEIHDKNVFVKYPSVYIGHSCYIPGNDV